MRNLKQQIINLYLENNILKSDAIAEYNLLIKHIAGFSNKDLILNPNLKLNDEQIKKLLNIVTIRVKEKTPLQYLINTAHFMGSNYYVDENVLIPRPETELLVNELINISHSLKTPNIIDIGTGSGCIACSLAKHINNAKIFAVDISKEALKVAQKNALSLNLKDKIQFIQSNLLENTNDSFDIIVSNPPYIPLQEKKLLQEEVCRHEPDLALFAEDDKGVNIYRQIIAQSTQKLNKGGFIAFEIGVYYFNNTQISQANEIKQMLENNNFSNIKVIKDLDGINRVIVAQFT